MPRLQICPIVHN